MSLISNIVDENICLEKSKQYLTKITQITLLLALIWTLHIVFGTYLNKIYNILCYIEKFEHEY